MRGPGGRLVEVVFSSPDPAPPVERVHEWLVEEGEPVEIDGEILSLRALPVRLHHESGPLVATVDPTADAPLERLVNLLFTLSVRIGADVLADGAPVDRGALWLRLAAHQDRTRIRRALDLAAERGNSDCPRRLWMVLAALAGRDRVWRWDTRVGGVVAWSEAHGEEFAWPVDDPTVYFVLWRWLSEAYPGLL